MSEIVIRNLKRIMKEKGINSTFGFIKLGIAPQTVDRILASSNCTLKTLEKLSTALQVDITEFFSEEE